MQFWSVPWGGGAVGVDMLSVDGGSLMRGHDGSMIMLMGAIEVRLRAIGGGVGAGWGILGRGGRGQRKDLLREANRMIPQLWQGGSWRRKVVDEVAM